MKRLTKRFIIENINDLNLSSPIKYERYYISKNTRVQQKGNIYEIEIIENNVDKIKKKISKTEFEKYTQNQKPSLIRNSYLCLDDNRVSIKEYLGNLKGFNRVEVTFETKEEMLNYQKEEWMGTEITNSSLAFDTKLNKLKTNEFKRLVEFYLKLSILEKKLSYSWCQETCYPNMQHNWTKNNMTLGQCAITALIINDYFGGDIYKLKIGEISHYINMINKEIIDLTKNQFGNKEVKYENLILKTRNEILNDNNTLNRYNILKGRINTINKPKLSELNYNDSNGEGYTLVYFYDYYYHVGEWASELSNFMYSFCDSYKVGDQDIPEFISAEDIIDRAFKLCEENNNDVIKIVIYNLKGKLIYEKEKVDRN